MTKRIELSKLDISRTLIEYKDRFELGEIIFAFSKLYIYKNGCDLYFIKSLSEVNQYSQFENNKLYDEILRKFNLFTLKNLEAIFEYLIDGERKKSEGAVYTPDYIIDYIINYSIQNYTGENIPIICDPACGCGGFLVRAIEILSETYNLEIKECVKYVRGIDINTQSISCAKIIIELYCLTKNIKIQPLDDKIIFGDTLLEDKYLLLNKLSASDGIDVLVTNPPYVKLQNIDLKYRKQLIEKFPKYTKGSFSFAILFLLAGEELLSKNGFLGYITQNNFFNSISSENIRNKLQHKKCIHTIIDFVHGKIFDNASAYTCLLFLTKNKVNEEFNFKWALNPKNDLLVDNFSKINVSELNSKKWRLAPKKHLDNIKKIEQTGIKLGDIADIKVGFATLKDTVFLLENNNSLNIENDILRPAIKISELINEDSIHGKQRRIIFPYKKINNKYIAYEENELKKQFPIAYTYLLKNKALLNTRSKGKKNLENFYEWGRTQGMEASSYKLLTKTFAGKPNFMLDKTDSLFCNGYSVKPKLNSNESLFGIEIDILVLQKILNSKIMDYYLKITSFQLDGNYQCFQKNFIEPFNIPILSNEDKEFINHNDGQKLDKYLAHIYKINFQDIQEIIHR